jgi:putative ABC transport system ATP-binding protein
MTDLQKTAPIVSAHAVSKQVITAAGELTILSDVSFEIAAGESVAVVGVSGSGKSTLLGLLAGLDLPSHGWIRLADQCLNDLDEDGRTRVRSENAGFVFQSFQLLPSLTALENVMLPLELAAAVGAQQQAEQLLERVGLSARADHYPRQLSGGEQQRVAIARAFAMSPPVLFADEPTGNLDTTTGQKVIELLFDLNSEQGTTLILVTHDEKLAGRCSRSIRLDAGRVVSDELAG